MRRPQGRPVLARGVYSFEDVTLLCPDRVVLDTSFVVEALIGSQPFHDGCRNYMLRLAEEGTQLLFSRLLEVELAEAVFQIALKERHPRDWRRFRSDGRVRRRAARLSSATFDAWSELLEVVPWRVVELDEVAELVPRLMADYGLGSYDAVHAATLIASEARVLVTIDSHFAALPADVAELHVDASRVKKCRDLRR